MKARRFVTRLGGSLVVTFALTSLGPAPLHAQGDHKHGSSSDNGQMGAFVRLVRESTERFKDVRVAEAEGYVLQFGCVSDDDAGAMGLHYVKGEYVGDDVLDPTRPEIIIYEPLPGGRRKLIGVDYLVFTETWHKSNAATPQLMGQLMHLFDAPNRFGLPAFYTLHVWAWKENPTGSFVNWHSKVSCDAYNPEP
jgi:hypothetical protein